MPSAPPRRRPPPFEPRFSIGLLYLFGFFFVYCFVLAAPALYEVLTGMAPGPEQQQQAEAAMRQALQGKLVFALGAALATTGLLSYAGVLPGTGRRR